MVRKQRHEKRSKKRKQAGLPPGTVIFTGEEREGAGTLRYLRYTRDEVFEEVLSYDQLPEIKAREGVQWIRMEGIHDVELLQRIGDSFGLHALTLEDITNTAHRPKLEEFEQYLVVILHHFTRNENDELQEENIAIVLTGNTVISFSLSPQTIFDPNRERIGAANGRFRARGADYLLYTLIDSVVDHYVLTLEMMDERVEEFEDRLLAEAQSETIAQLHTQRRQLLQLRRAALPLRDVVMQLQREEMEMIGDDISMFLHDVQDHLNQVLDTLEGDRETINGLIELYMTQESNRMNEVMKVLTIIATVFIPLTFIAGVYGMNFQYMPELQSVWGYPVVLVVMLAVAGSMFVFFRRRRWL